MRSNYPPFATGIPLPCKPSPVRTFVTICALLAGLNTSAAATTTYSNNDAIVLPELTAGAANPYPSSIVVAGQTAAVEKITVTLQGITHAFPDDLDIILVGPRGGKTFLMSDAGIDSSLSGVTLTFDDEAGQALPDVDRIVAGTYRPSNYGTPADAFDAPAPPGPYVTNLAVFRNTDPNGTWSLFVMDDLPEDSGFLSGYRLELTTQNPIADLGVAIAPVQAPFYVGQPLAYDLMVTNRGPADAAQVVLTNLVPAQISISSVTPSQGSCVQNGSVLVCELGTLLLGQSAAVRIAGAVFGSTTLNTSATVATSYLDLAPANNQASLSMPVLPAADLQLASVSTATPVFHNQNLEFIVGVTNAGPSSAGQVVLTNRLDPTLSFVSAEPGVGSCMHENGIVRCDLSDLTAGQGTQIHFTALATQPGTVTNRVSVRSATADLNEANSVLLSLAAIQPLAALAIAPVSAPAAAPLGSTNFFAFQITNRGPSTAQGNQLVWISTNGWSLVDAESNGGACAQEDHVIMCSLPDLEAGQTALISLAATPAGIGTATNLFQLESMTADLELTDNSVSVATTVYRLFDALAQLEPIATTNAGPAVPYPSTLEVSGFTTAVYKVSVTLHRLYHEFPDDLSVLLVGPTGQSAFLMADAGGSHAVTNVTLSFDDDAPAMLSNVDMLTSGTYRPSQLGSAEFEFPSPAPPRSYPTNLSAFVGTNPNGAWSLYVVDSRAVMTGSILEGWSLSLGTLHPLVPSSQFTIIETLPDGSTHLEFLGQTEFEYVVQYSEDFQSWMDLGPATPVAGGRFVFTDNTAADARFYRVRSD